MRKWLKPLSEWLLIGYVVIGIVLILLDISIGEIFIFMFFGAGIGFMFAGSHYDSVWKLKYLKLLEGNYIIKKQRID